MTVEKGMTLIEVMVALLLLSVTGLSFLRASQEQTRHLDHVLRKQVAGWVAEDRLKLLMIQGSASVQSGLTGESQQGGQKWYWQQQVIPTDRADINAIEIKVSDTPDMASPLFRLYTWKP